MFGVSRLGHFDVLGGLGDPWGWSKSEANIKQKISQEVLVKAHKTHTSKHTLDDKSDKHRKNRSTRSVFFAI